MNLFYRHFLRYLIFGVIFVVFVFPVYWMVLTAFKPADQVITYPPRFYTSQPTLDGFREALEARGNVVLKNSLIIAVAVTIISIAVGSLAAYSFARFRVGGFHLPFWILSTRMTPAVAAIIPLFLLINKLGLIDTLPAVMITHLVLTLPFAVWLLRGFFMEIPMELEEAAMVDGASRLTAFFRVVLPIAAPGLAVTGFFCFIFSWNEFMFALILTRRVATTLPVLISGMHAAHGVLWSTMSALAVLGIIPVVILAIIAQRYLIRGMTLGAVD
jgi:multiple sugar transport system permease protein